jgi:hypothetical protein
LTLARKGSTNHQQAASERDQYRHDCGCVVILDHLCAVLSCDLSF